MTDNTRVYNQDCMVGMKEFPDKYFELAICDPPYGIGLDMVTGVDSLDLARHAPFY